MKVPGVLPNPISAMPPSFWVPDATSACAALVIAQLPARES
ncbi:MAG: hypothetical protein WDN31_02220 [Hyphomicrobium sp.]